MRFSKMLNYIKNVWDQLNILAPNSKLFKRKSPCKSTFQNKLFADVSDPADHFRVPHSLCFKANLLRCTEHALPNDQRPRRGEKCWE